MFSVVGWALGKGAEKADSQDSGLHPLESAKAVVHKEVNATKRGMKRLSQLGWIACDALVVADISARHAVEWSHLSGIYVIIFGLVAGLLLLFRGGVD